MPDFTVRLADWQSDRDDLYAIRRTVFIIEQEVPEEIEVDEHDPHCVHVLALDADQSPIGTARLMPDGRVGRVAVLEPWRKKGVGTALMKCLMDEAGRNGIAPEALHLHAQSWTVPFYESLGFIVDGEEFDEAGIPHRPMILGQR